MREAYMLYDSLLSKLNDDNCSNNNNNDYVGVKWRCPALRKNKTNHLIDLERDKQFDNDSNYRNSGLSDYYYLTNRVPDYKKLQRNFNFNQHHIVLKSFYVCQYLICLSLFCNKSFKIRLFTFFLLIEEVVE